MRKLYGCAIMILIIFTSIGGPSGARAGFSVVSRQGQTLDFSMDYRALVVGISDYERWPKLPNAVNDAREVEAKLREMGFEVPERDGVRVGR
jgi:hypothetical protein